MDGDPVHAAKHREKEPVRKQEARKTGEHTMTVQCASLMCAWNCDACMRRVACDL